MTRALHTLTLMAISGFIWNACSKATVHEVPISPPRKEDVGTRDGALQELRRQLAIVRAARPTDRIEGAEFDVGPLTNAARGEIEAVLGTGSVCVEAGSDLCASAGDSYYSVYHLPEHFIGGGPELMLRYGGTDRVVKAVWVHTQ